MPSSFPYGTFCNYSPRGTSELAIRSQRICGGIKRGSVGQIERAIPLLRDERAAALMPLFSAGTVLIPVPRSAPLQAGALWPSDVIARTLAANGFGDQVAPLLKRVHAVQKSSSSPAKDRPLVNEHLESLRVDARLMRPERITLVDDVLTMGRTSFACASLLNETYPDAEIHIFAMVRTQGVQDDIRAIFDPSVGTITGYPSGKTYRDP